MGPKLAKWVLSVLLALILLLSVAPALASSPAETTDTLLPGSDLEASEQGGEVYQVTLITGDVVTVTISGDGQRSFAISPADPSKLGQHFLTIEQQGDTYIIPDGIDLEKLDRQLFNIDYLVDEQYYESISLPLLVSYLPGLAGSQVQSLEGRVTALGQETELHNEVSTISTQLAYENISRSYSSLVSQPEVSKIWLDKKVHAQLMDSVPLIGAPSWWGAGYNGTGAKIAILDTGIDSSHPALDDLDDNAATNDPKVIANVNFTDDANFDDLFGHGTHVAGIAAGTQPPGPQWTEVAPASFPPARSGHAMVFDSGRNKVVLFGGWGGTDLSDTWEYDGASQTWTEVTPVSSPPARNGHTMVFDSSRNRVILFGGYNGNFLSDTWEYDGANNTWTELTTAASPPARGDCAMVFDSSRNKVVLFGGWNGDILGDFSYPLGDMWEYDVTNNIWTELTPLSSPPNRAGHAMVFDSSRDKAVLFGGWGLLTRYNDTWEYDSNNQTWTEVTPASSPPARTSHAMVFDSNRNKIVLFSGHQGYPSLNDTWEYDGASNNWTEVIPLFSPPASAVHAMVFDSSRNKVVLFGGQIANDHGFINTWEYSVTLPEPAIRGVAPGAWLWNVKVLNQWGWGYESWVINGIKFASLGQDGLPGTGDEADIINMSLGGGWQSDGTDPVSKAVNLAVERGVTVVVAAGNNGYSGWFTIATPGVAEKVITVGASAKDDTLAGFSSQGPTVDMRIKPDILAPGVDITSAVPYPTYGTKSGTSMATPHVAGAAALLLQYYGGNATPQFIKDTLMSTAKDLGYSVYEQGSGRLDLSWEPWPEVGVTPASLRLGMFTSANTTASGNFTFFNTDNISHQVTLSANLTDVISGGDYSANVTFNPASFTVPAGGQVEVSLNIDLTTLPASVYSGKVIATVDGGASRTIQAIFGFIKLHKVTVHKININGAPAQKHPLWVLMESPFQDMMYQWVYTDASGDFTILALDGNYHLISPNWGHAENQTTIWTIAENVTISSDMTITLDERDTKLVDFDPNQVGLMPSAKSSTMRYDFVDYGRYHWGSSWWYPSSFLTRVSPVSLFDAGFNYNAYPEADFNSDDPRLVNTGEWYNLIYSVENIIGNITFVADYNNLVHRNTGYGVALNGERAEWAQWSWDNISKYGGFEYLMDAPQQRWEWLSPNPVGYGQYYTRANPWGEWYYDRYGRSYLPGEYSLRFGGHPLTSGVNIGIGWNVPYPPAPQPALPAPPPAPEPPPVPPASEASGSEEVDGVNRLSIYGTISRDSSLNDLLNAQAKYSGEIKVTQDSDNVVLKADIWDSFSRGVYFTGNPRFTVEVWGEAKLDLSGGSYTRLDFTANATTDYRPPQLRFQVPGINLFGVTPPGEVTSRVYVSDESSLDFVRLHYSLDDGTNWTDAGLPTFADGAYTFNLGQLQGTFVSLAVDATDEYGNHIHRNTYRAFYVGSPGVQVSVNAPGKVIPTGNFTATIAINYVENLDAANYDVSFNSTVLRLDNATAGQIGTSGNFTVIPVDIWNESSPGVVTIAQNVPGLSGVSGSGYLAALHFSAIGPLGNSSTITLSDGVLSNIFAEGIPAAWIGDCVEVGVVPGDANGDGDVNAVDITKVERIIVKLDNPTPGADANQDGNINAIDITKVERIIVGLD